MFWKDKPINEEIPMEILTKSVSPNDKYLVKSYKQLENVEVFLKFINNNYFCVGDKFRFRYSMCHMEYFLSDGGWLSIHSCKFPETIIGVVAYRIVEINDGTTSSEVDFLCIKHELRGISLAEFIINKVTSMIIKQGISTCFFTGMDVRNARFYFKKGVYIYTLNYEKCIGSKYIPLCLIKKIVFINDDCHYMQCVNYDRITDMYNQLYVKEKFKREECFIDYIVDSRFIFRFMKIDVVSGDTTIKAVILYYSNAKIEKYLNNIGYLLWKEHRIDSVSIYSSDNLDIDGIYKTKSNIYYYSYNKTINARRVSMNPI
jgi:hypothetical protein